MSTVLLFGATVSHADQRNFIAINNTGRTIEHLYVSPHESNNWGGDVLGRFVLPSGYQTPIVFNPSFYSSCVMDMKVVFSDGSSQTYRNEPWDVCNTVGVQFNRYNS